MDHVVTLVSNPDRPALDAAALSIAREAIGEVAQIVELSAGVAVDIGIGEARGVDERLRLALAGRPIDICVQKAAGRRKHLLVSDMDSTIIEQECIDELADYVGAKAEVAAITERAMRGELAFEPALRHRVAVLKGLPVSVIDEVVRSRLSLMPGAMCLTATMRRNGARLALVSGGFTVFTEAIARIAGFDEHHGNRLIVENGRFAGTVAEPILGDIAKLDRLRHLTAELRLTDAETMAVGDGANDLRMLGAAGLGVAFRAKPAVAKAASARIDHGDLTGLLYLQGYRKTDFARAA